MAWNYPICAENKRSRSPLMSTMKKKKNSSGSLVVLALILHCCAVCAAAADTDPAEVTALKSIKASFGDPNNKLKNWGRGDPCNSHWLQVVCFNNTGSDGYLHVQELRLIGLGLTGNISPAFGQLLHLEILDVMWNNISGNIPKEIGNIKSLKLLLLNGNKLSGPLPEELGFLPVLDRIQIDQNRISGQLPKTFANLNKTKHFHMNNNSISGEIPKELYRLPSLVHMLLDNNNLTGELPSELAEIPNLLILQLDNNQLNSEIPPSYVNMSKLLKLSLRNCSLRGSIPDLGHIPDLGYLDLSYNRLTGNIPSQRLSQNITTIDLSHNQLNGSIPVSFADLPLIQRISLDNNKLSGSVPSNIGLNVSFNSTATLQLDYRNNSLSNITGSLNLPQNISLWLEGNPICNQGNIVNIAKNCGTGKVSEENSGAANNGSMACTPNSCSPPTEYIPFSGCLCANPLVVGYRLKSPGFTNFMPYMEHFQIYITHGLNLSLHQVYLSKYVWEPGPRLAMILKIFPMKDASPRELGESETNRLVDAFAGWKIPDDDRFGPYEWINITINGRGGTFIEHIGSGLSKGAIAGIVIGSIVGTAIVFVIIMILFLRQRIQYGNAASKRRLLARRKPIKIAGVKDFTFEEMALATNNFSASMQIGQGGYGKVYKGILGDGTVAAVKRAQEGSLQGEKEFSTEIELLSRVHHRNLVSLLGFCDDEGEQMLVYEFMGNGTLRDHLSASSKMPLSFEMRLRIAIGSAKGILYLHTEANPPIFHRDIKASNILLDDRYVAKVADFGLSKLAPVPELDGSAPGHVSTVVKGTPGYLDPEYFLTHKLTDKSDVYSFGVVLLELLTGMQPISHGKNIVREVNMARSSGMILSVVDPRMGPYPSECLEPLVRLALKCCEDETDARPSMAEVVRELEKILQLSPSLDSTPMDSVEIDISVKQKETFVEMTTQNPYVSSDVPGSDLLSGTIPNIAPR